MPNPSLADPIDLLMATIAAIAAAVLLFFLMGLLRRAAQEVLDFTDDV